MATQPRTVSLPTLHADQIRALRVLNRSRRGALRCGRRWGKTVFGITVGCDLAIRGKRVGWFAPEYKFYADTYRQVESILEPVKKRSSSGEGMFRTTTGGYFDFWSLENDLAGRGREYDVVIIDEGAFTKSTMMSMWEKNIEPTLLVRRGRAIVMSNTNGVDPENFLWQICNQPEKGFIEYHAPASSNPIIHPDELAKLKASKHPMVFSQEYLAEFVDFRGLAFFGLGSLLVDNQPVPWPIKCDAVYATIDTATKTGRANDGTAVIYWALNKVSGRIPLTILDWDCTQIEGALLETWLPTVFQNLERMAATTGARSGSLGAFIEDKSSGMVLLQQALRRSWPAQPIESALTALGKDERAISVSGYVYSNMVKFSQPAYDRTKVYKDVSRNHLVGQVCGFRVGDVDNLKREDDLLDDFCYGIAIGLGDSGGF